MSSTSEPTLLGLPPELRDRIWELVLQHNRSHAYDKVGPRCYVLKIPATMQLCRQTRIETLPMFFGELEPTFAVYFVDKVGHIRGWQDDLLVNERGVLTPEMIAQIRRVKILLHFLDTDAPPHSHAVRVNFANGTVQEELVSGRRCLREHEGLGALVENTLGKMGFRVASELWFKDLFISLERELRNWASRRQLLHSTAVNDNTSTA